MSELISIKYLVFFWPVAIVLAFLTSRRLPHIYIERVYYITMMIGVFGLYFSQIHIRQNYSALIKRDKLQQRVASQENLFAFSSLHPELPLEMVAESHRLNLFYIEAKKNCLQNQKSLACKVQKWLFLNTEVSSAVQGYIPIQSTSVEFCEKLLLMRRDFYKFLEEQVSCIDDLETRHENLSCTLESSLSVEEEFKVSIPGYYNFFQSMREEVAFDKPMERRNGMLEQFQYPDRGPSCGISSHNIVIRENIFENHNKRVLELDLLNSEIEQQRVPKTPKYVAVVYNFFWAFILLFGLCLKFSITFSLEQKNKEEGNR